MFFDKWTHILQVILSAVVGYAALVLFLRVSGKRTLSKMNAFDLVITVAFGSCLASTILSKEVAIVEGIVSFVVLIGLQWVVAWSSMRSPLVRGLVKSEPTLLFYRGNFLDDTMRKERVVKDEVRAAIRSSGAASLDQIDSVVLETDGTFSVISSSKEDNMPTAMEGVLQYPSA